MINIYHCTVHKAASTFFRLLFRDDRLAPRLPFKAIHFETDIKRSLFDCYYHSNEYTIPEKAIVTNVCCSYDTFKNKLKKNNDYTGFYLYRDPREIVVSTYWSWKNSHGGGHPMRVKLKGMNEIDGYNFVIDQLHQKLRCFDAMADWVKNCVDNKFTLLKFESFFDDINNNLRELFFLLGLQIPDNVVLDLASRYSFSSLAGRPRGKEDLNSHYRCGSANTWEEKMPDESKYHFDKVVDKKILDILGY